MLDEGTQKNIYKAHLLANFATAHNTDILFWDR